MNKKRKGLNKVTDNKTYNVIYKKFVFNYCYICQRRAGSYYANCDGKKRWGYHGNGKPIYSRDYRRYKSWKHNRRTQYKN